MRTLSISGILIAFTIAIALWAQDNIPRTQAIPAARRTIQTTDGQTLQGQVLAEGMTDLQLRTDDKKIRLLRKADGNRYRVVTSQTDWPTYNGDPSGNRYSKLTQIDKSNVARLAPRGFSPCPVRPPSKTRPWSWTA